MDGIYCYLHDTTVPLPYRSELLTTEYIISSHSLFQLLLVEYCFESNEETSGPGRSAKVQSQTSEAIDLAGSVDVRSAKTTAREKIRSFARQRVIEERKHSEINNFGTVQRVQKNR